MVPSASSGCGGGGLPRPGSSSHRDRDKGPPGPQEEQQARAHVNLLGQKQGEWVRLRKPFQLRLGMPGQGQPWALCSQGPSHPREPRDPSAPASPQCRRDESTNGGMSAETRLPWSPSPSLTRSTRLGLLPPPQAPMTQFNPLHNLHTTTRTRTQHHTEKASDTTQAHPAQIILPHNFKTPPPAPHNPAQASQPRTPTPTPLLRHTAHPITQITAGPQSPPTHNSPKSQDTFASTQVPVAHSNTLLRTPQLRPVPHSIALLHTPQLRPVPQP